MGTRLVVGCMSGTSMDGVDAALVEVVGRGLGLRARALRFHSEPLSPEYRADFLAFAQQHTPLPASAIARHAAELASVHVRAIREVLGPAPTAESSGTRSPMRAVREVMGPTPDLIAVHGQTLFHAPPSSWQLFQPSSLARMFRAPVVFDLRAADLAAGGEGAPITPLADFVLFRDPAKRRTLVNLGGFANFTALPAVPEGADSAALLAQIRGGDICICNQLLDRIVRERAGLARDEGGWLALNAAPDDAGVAFLAERLQGQAVAGRSLGSVDQSEAWINDFLTRFAALTPADAARTAGEAIAQTIVRALPPSDEVVLAGGGVKNRALVHAIVAALVGDAPTAHIFGTGALGVPIDQREPVCMAVLGALCADRVPITLPQITHVPAPAPIAGAWVFPDGVDPVSVFNARE